MATFITHIFVVIEGVEDVIRQTAQKIDDEPAFEIVHPDDFWIGDDFTTRSHERGMEIKNYVNKEYHIDD